MSNDQFEDLIRTLFPPPKTDTERLNDVFKGLLGYRSISPPPAAPSLPLPRERTNGLSYLAGLLAPLPPPPSLSPRIAPVSNLAYPVVPSMPQLPNGSPRISLPPLTSNPTTEGSVAWCTSIVTGLLTRKVAVIPGRVLPGIDDLAVMEGRRIRAAFVYSDLHGFTKLVATQPTNKSFVFLHAFVEIASRLTKHYNGQVMDCAGDRVLSVFHRPLGDLSNEPVEEAITFALWMQTVFRRVIAPAFAGAGAPNLSLGIGVDYGEAVVGCVGMRNNKRIVFFGDAANHAAKLQEEAKEGETVISAAADLKRPSYLDNGLWAFRRETLNGEVVLRTSDWVNADVPPRPR